MSDNPNQLRAIIIPKHMADFLFAFVNGGYHTPLRGDDSAKYNQLIGMLVNCEYSAAELIPEDRRQQCFDFGVWE